MREGSVTIPLPLPLGLIGTRMRVSASATTAMADAGILVDSGALQPPQAATTVRVRDGETLLSGGPFAEIKDQLGVLHPGLRA